jgi:hypothetical protein
VAQLGARLDGIEEGEGSNPFGSTKSQRIQNILCKHSASREVLERALLCGGFQARVGNIFRERIVIEPYVFVQRRVRAAASQLGQ